jgi:hypothetical protein
LSIFQKFAEKYRTPRQVQHLITSLKYNESDSIQSAKRGLKSKCVHCLEGAFIAAALLEHHGYPPLVMSLESLDNLDHVMFIFKKNGRWGAVAQSSDRGLRGRAPVYRTVKALAMSYFEPYIDLTGCITAYQVANLNKIKADWRNSDRNVKKAEDYLIDIKHIKIPYNEKRHKRFRDLCVAGKILPRQKNWW